MMTSKTHYSPRESGYTLIEVMTAIVVLTTGILSLYALHINSIKTEASANNMTQSATWASSRIEELLNRPYDCTPYAQGCNDLDDVNGDGTNQDTDGDGIDDSGADTTFGLDNATVMTADHFLTSPDGTYTIFWNVAVDTPVPDTKTIRVIVTSTNNGVTRSIPMTYYKSK